MWQPIEDYAVNFGGVLVMMYRGDFLLYCPDRPEPTLSPFVVGYYIESLKSWGCTETGEILHPTHFLDIPAIIGVEHESKVA